MKKIVLVFALMIVQVFSKEYKAPSDSYSLGAWKFESPTGANIKDLNGFSSKYFYLSDENLLCFDIDTNNTSTKSLNNELRNLNNWYVNSTHQLSVTMKAIASPKSYKLVVAQIYGIDDSNVDVASLMKLVIEDGNLYAYIKKNNQSNDIILLKENVINKFFSFDINIDNKNLSIQIDGEEMVSRNVGFWNYRNYFKVGAYPQSKYGEFQVYLNNLSVY